MGGLPGQVNESPPRGRITRDALQLRGEDDCHANDTSAAGHGVLGVLVVVGVAAVLVEGFVFSASRLWFMPDSAWYISLATGLAERWDFSQNLFQFRTPGYPLFLAALFLLFGHSAGVALLVVQHAMVVGLFTVECDDRVDPLAAPESGHHYGGCSVQWVFISAVTQVPSLPKFRTRSC